MAFDFVRNVSVFELNKKTDFYILLIKELTILNRIIIYSDTTKNEIKLERIKHVNEIMHILLNRIQDLRNDSSVYSEDSIWNMIQEEVFKCSDIKGDVGVLILESYKKINE